jgi:EAL domain-containing protein (putative c-di-GMP-specific phosphodiesterase class I)
MPNFLPFRLRRTGKYDTTQRRGSGNIRVLDTALRQLAQWREAGHQHRLSVNVSASNLQDPYFAEQAQLQILRHRVRPEWLELEVTESAVMSNVANATRQLTTLVEAGIHIAIDDFGTGHSSLAYLQTLPAKILKIDQSFIREIDSGERQRTLVRSMVSLAHDLGYHVVAEGAETATLRDWVIALGCDEAQGYCYGRPMRCDDFLTWLSDSSRKEDVLAGAA